MRSVGAEEVHRLLDYPALVDALDAMFREGCEAPVRHHHTIDRTAFGPDEPDATLLLMPAWQAHGRIGVKIATVFPGNAARGLPGVMASYLLLDGETGAPRALIDGTALTARRTAAASALAARYLAREDAARMVMVGTGALAPRLIAAHASQRPLSHVAVWGRRPERARAVAEAVLADGALPGVAVEPVDDLEAAVQTADLVSCATLARDPLVSGGWLAPGAHLDLVGGFTPAMREADDAAVTRARLFVDTRAGALEEAGDIVEPRARGVIAEADIVADLHALARGEAAGRRGPDEITLFKSVGAALEDLAAAILIADKAGL